MDKYEENVDYRRMYRYAITSRGEEMKEITESSVPLLGRDMQMLAKSLLGWWISIRRPTNLNRGNDIYVVDDNDYDIYFVNFSGDISFIVTVNAYPKKFGVSATDAKVLEVAIYIDQNHENIYWQTPRFELMKYDINTGKKYLLTDNISYLNFYRDNLYFFDRGNLSVNIYNVSVMT